MDSSSKQNTTIITTSTSMCNYEDPLMISSSSSFDPLPLPSSSSSYLPTFRSSPPTNAATADPSPSRSNPHPPQPPRTSASSSSKKRTRASRRAPTTVLTTDTTNFRAMVQEFTGFPAPPFSLPSSSSLLRSPTFLPSSIIHGPAANISATIPIHAPPPAPPLFGDLSSLVAAAAVSEGMQLQQQHQVGRTVGGLPSWQEYGDSSARSLDGQDHELRQPEKRQRTRDGMADPWIHSSH